MAIMNRGVSDDPVPAQSAKRQLDATADDPVPAKRARLTPPATQPALQQPRPTRPGTAFLKEFVDPLRQPVQSLVSDWLESVGSDRQTRCQSETGFRRPADSPVPRRFARSVPEMSHSRDSDGYLVPLTPASGGPRAVNEAWSASYTGSVAPSDASTPVSSRSAGKSLVEDPTYRDTNLKANNIHLRHPCDPIPDHIAALVAQVGRDRHSPSPSMGELKQDPTFFDLSMGAPESQVEKHFYSRIFPDPKSSETLSRSDRQPMSKHTVPNTDPKYKVSTPVPDALYGYRPQVAFAEHQPQLRAMGNSEMAANNNRDLFYPFLVVEFKGDGPGSLGSLWVATNQCLGGSAACVNIAERLNRHLKQCNRDEVRPVNSAAFSFAIRGTEARLYVMWKHDHAAYYMQQVGTFVLDDPEHYLKFRKYTLNIMEWGREQRLKEIRDSLDVLAEEAKKRAEEVKNRPAPSDAGSSGGSSASSRSKRQKNW